MYKYLCGERIWLRISKKKRVKHLFDLKEFIKYLTHRKRINGHVIDVCAKVLSALITVVLMGRYISGIRRVKRNDKMPKNLFTISWNNAILLLEKDATA